VSKASRNWFPKTTMEDVRNRTMMLLPYTRCGPSAFPSMHPNNEERSTLVLDGPGDSGTENFRSHCISTTLSSVRSLVTRWNQVPAV